MCPDFVFVTWVKQNKSLLGQLILQGFCFRWFIYSIKIGMFGYNVKTNSCPRCRLGRIGACTPIWKEVLLYPGQLVEPSKVSRFVSSSSASLLSSVPSVSNRADSSCCSWRWNSSSPQQVSGVSLVFFWAYSVLSGTKQAFSFLLLFHLTSKCNCYTFQGR